MQAPILLVTFLEVCLDIMARFKFILIMLSMLLAMAGALELLFATTGTKAEEWSRRSTVMVKS
jgi:hypothetical protein